MKKKYIITAVILLIIVFSLIFFWQFYQSSSKHSSTESLSGNVILEDIKDLCPMDYQMKILYKDFENKDANHDCSNLVGGVRDGEVDLQIEFINNNEISLSVPCKFVFVKNNLKSDEPYAIDRKENPSFLVNMPPRSTEVIRERINIPECYDYWELNCKDVDELPECN